VHLSWCRGDSTEGPGPGAGQGVIRADRSSADKRALTRRLRRGLTTPACSAASSACLGSPMPSPRPTSPQRRAFGSPHNPPTKPQLDRLRRLSRQTGTTFATPRSSRDASAEITRLLALPRSSHTGPASAEAHRELHAIRDALATSYGTADRPDHHDDEHPSRRPTSALAARRGISSWRPASSR
jgi:hypothetical protein